MLLKPPATTKFTALHKSTSYMALWSIGAIEDDDLLWVICSVDGQMLIQPTWQKLRVDTAFENIYQARRNYEGSAY